MIDELINEQALNYVKNEIYEDASISYSNKNKAIIGKLYEKGIFQIKDSVPKIAEELNISKNTVYLHLRNMTASEGQ